jgi:hypothetical protein
MNFTLHKVSRNYLFVFIMDSAFCEVRAKAEETTDDLKITTEANSFLCEVRAEAEETADNLTITDTVFYGVRAKGEITTETYCVICEGRAEGEETAENLVLSAWYDLRPMKQLTI